MEAMGAPGMHAARALSKPTRIGEAESLPLPTALIAGYLKVVPLRD